MYTILFFAFCGGAWFAFVVWLIVRPETKRERHKRLSKNKPHTAKPVAAKQGERAYSFEWSGKKFETIEELKFEEL